MWLKKIVSLLLAAPAATLAMSCADFPEMPMGGGMFVEDGYNLLGESDGYYRFALSSSSFLNGNLGKSRFKLLPGTFFFSAEHYSVPFAQTVWRYGRLPSVHAWNADSLPFSPQSAEIYLPILQGQELRRSGEGIIPLTTGDLLVPWSLAPQTAKYLYMDFTFQRAVFGATMLVKKKPLLDWLAANSPLDPTDECASKEVGRDTRTLTVGTSVLDFEPGKYLQLSTADRIQSCNLNGDLAGYYEFNANTLQLSPKRKADGSLVDAPTERKLLSLYCRDAGNAVRAAIFVNKLPPPPPDPELIFNKPSPVTLARGDSAVLSITNATDIGSCTASAPTLVAIGQKSADNLSVNVTVPDNAPVVADTPLVTITCTSGSRVLNSPTITLKSIQPTLSIEKTSLALGESTVLSINNATSIGPCAASSALVAITQIQNSTSSVSVTVSEDAKVDTDTPVVITCGTLKQSVTLTKSSVVSPIKNELTFAAGSVPTELKLVSRSDKTALLNSKSGVFDCASEYVDYQSDKATLGQQLPPGKLTLKPSVPSIPSSPVRAELSCKDSSSYPPLGTYNTWKENFYISKDSAGKIQLFPMLKAAEAVANAPILLEGTVPPPTDAAEGKLANVWFEAVVEADRARYTLSGSNSWTRKADFSSDSVDTALTVSYKPNGDYGFSFNVGQFTHETINAYTSAVKEKNKEIKTPIKGIVYYQLQNGTVKGPVRQLNTVWTP